ncbi:hypothetical protein HYX07_01785 [Candidatus Woesearchaeota archaeon]|nr:hypothetical protein [Candidatus Woesearchaeota archaeon]
MKYIIEHLEPELYEWCLIEYVHISKIVGKNRLIFTNVKGKKSSKKLRKFGSVFEKSVSVLGLKGICVLSQYSKKTLKTKDKDAFRYFVFGGILGDNPAKKRTNAIIKKLKSKKIRFQERNLGNRQMPTDTAVYVAKRIFYGKKLGDLKFVDNLEIEVNENESININFRYALDGNKAIISDKLVNYLRNRKEF